MSKTVEFTLDGKIVTAEAEMSLWQVAKTQGTDIPHLCYKDDGKFPTGPWCKEKDWILFGRYAGARIKIDGGELRLLNDDEVMAVVKDPEYVLSPLTN